MKNISIILIVFILSITIISCDLFLGSNISNEIKEFYKKHSDRDTNETSSNIYIPSIYVRVSGDDSKSGLTPDEALKTINLAIEKALSSGRMLIRIELGVYTSGSGLNSNSSGVYVTNISNLTIEGGYDSSFSNILGYSELDGNGSLYHIIFISNSVNVGVKNFVIRGGNANGSFPDYVGGGVLVIGSSGITLTNVVISNNSADYYGGGIYLVSSHYNTFSGSVVSNSATYNGGGIYLDSSFNNTLSGSVLSNSANNGGGIYLYNSTNNTLSGSVLNNSANNGGGIYLSSSHNNTLSGSVLNNIATDYGGGIYLEVSHTNTLSGSVSNNSANNGGGIYLSSSHNNTLSGSVLNNSANNGGGIYLASSHTNVIQGEVSYNYANSGGGIYLINVNNISFTSLTNKANTNYGISIINSSDIIGFDNNIIWGSGALINVPSDINRN